MMDYGHFGWMGGFGWCLLGAVVAVAPYVRAAGSIFCSHVQYVGACPMEILRRRYAACGHRGRVRTGQAPAWLKSGEADRKKSMHAE
jgi:hypothetical protein